MIFRLKLFITPLKQIIIIIINNRRMWRMFEILFLLFWTKELLRSPALHTIQCFVFGEWCVECRVRQNNNNNKIERQPPAKNFSLCCCYYIFTGPGQCMACVLRLVFASLRNLVSSKSNAELLVYFVGKFNQKICAYELVWFSQVDTFQMIYHFNETNVT